MSRLKIEQAKDVTSVASYAVDKVNWPKEFPSKPEVSFRISHDGDNLYVRFDVHEDEIVALATADNGSVWEDSCVEMFLAFNSEHYYNLECNCVGTVLFRHQTKDKSQMEFASPEVLSIIKRDATLGREAIAKQKGDFRWSVTLTIPKEALWMEDLLGFEGLKIKGNFYKCGDGLSIPHFLSWNPINTPAPNFHCPDFFGEMQFN